MIYLLDTSGLVRLLADPAVQAAWEQAIVARTVGSCYVQRSEFLYSARDAHEFDELNEMFADLYPNVAVPKQAGTWINATQHRLSRLGQHRSASAVDLLIAATAAHHGLTVLHDDNDFRTVAKHATDLTEHNIRDY
ncbi:putative nucleic acid-binding protein [Nocardia tenerifensis]|uniref:Ribonuclease VapC n=1 Tax=Nocardia tenerifensis TaxID=228006 RepID=A0A318KW09_9NOCA|nr:PIN domain-containing protein [Nocardia tenerifensis]PXX68941.1 putative nucleic acid-binding protein [Nocardia tenerifensis]